MAVARHHITQGPLRVFSNEYRAPESESVEFRLPEAVNSEFQKLEGMVVEQCADRPDALCHISASLHDLKEIYRAMKYFRSERTADIWIWAVTYAWLPTLHLLTGLTSLTGHLNNSFTMCKTITRPH